MRDCRDVVEDIDRRRARLIQNVATRRELIFVFARRRPRAYRGTLEAGRRGKRLEESVASGLWCARKRLPGWGFFDCGDRVQHRFFILRRLRLRIEEDVERMRVF